MKKEFLDYKNLSKQELECLKDTYVERKIMSMNVQQLKDFVKENISHQIKDTICEEEEIEAWNEMKIFFNDELDLIIEKIQNQFQSNMHAAEIIQDNISKRTIFKHSEDESNKVDMWED